MKFHHLARHNQFVVTAAAVAAAAAAQQQNNQLASSQRGLSPTKILPNQHQQATSQFGGEQNNNSSNSNNHNHNHNNNNNNNNMSDEEDDDYNEAQPNYFDAVLHQSNQNGPLGLSSSQQQASSQQQQQQQHDSNFLMDKNKKLFPQKLWELIHNPSIQHCLRWSQDGQRVYLNRNEFEAYYLKTPNNQFHTQKAISFVRQMNMYGFRKVDDCYYENDNFRRDRQHLLRNMIRRHPNKGLFVGLDHHQLAAAAAAQQALQVNQQLQQLENQHKHRHEQALRLNSYLNNHQFHHHHHHQQLSHHIHSSSFDHMSTSQLVAQVAAANQLSQQQQQQQQQHHQQLHQQQSSINQQQQQLAANTMTTNNCNLDNNQPTSGLYQHNKKSRLLSNFYANSTTNNSGSIQAKQNSLGNGSTSQLGIHLNNKAELEENQEHLHSQDSMHSSSSVESEPSQCSSVVNSAGSPQPNSPNSLNGVPVSLASQLGLSHHQSHSSVIRAAVLAAAAAQQQQQQQQQQQNSNNKFEEHQLTATDLSQANNQQHDLASRQAALHQTLVRSLLQLKQHPNQQELLASTLSSNNSRFLLESMASLSSAGTASSIVDPTSNSPTERTATPPSIPSSPAAAYNINNLNNNNNTDTSKESNVNIGTNNNNMALDLAKSSSSSSIRSTGEKRKANNFDQDDEDELFNEVEDREIESDARQEDTEVEDEGSPLEGEKKVRRFLDKHMQQRTNNNRDNVMIKRELMESEPEEQIIADSLKKKKKRRRLTRSSADQKQASLIDDDDDNISISSISKSLILEFCDKRGDRLEINALNEAARYTECFLDVLLENASTIARSNFSSSASTSSITSNESNVDIDKEVDKELNVEGSSDGSENGSSVDGKISSVDKCAGSDKGSLVDTSSLSLALKLIPSKLIAAIEQQQQVVRLATNVN